MKHRVAALLVSDAPWTGWAARKAMGLSQATTGANAARIPAKTNIKVYS
jgi:hypothetical protein